MACEETNGYMSHKRPMPGSLGHLSQLTSHLPPSARLLLSINQPLAAFQEAQGLLPRHARSFRFESFALLLPYLQCLPVSPVYLVSDKIEYVSDSTPRLQGHRGDSPLHDFPSVPPPELLPEATPVCQHATSSDFTLVSWTEAVHTAPFYVRV